MTFLGVLIVGQIIMDDYLAVNRLPHSNLDTFFATLGLFKVSLPVKEGLTEIPSSIQVLRVIAPITTATTAITALYSSALRRLNMVVTYGWRKHFVAVGDTDYIQLLAKANARNGSRTNSRLTVLLSDQLDDENKRDLESLGIHVGRLGSSNASLKKIVRNAAAVAVECGDDETSIRRAWELHEMFDRHDQDKPQSVTVYVSDPDLTRLTGFFTDDRYSIVSRRGRLAEETLYLESPVRGPRGPLNVLIVSDDPQVTTLIGAIWNQHVQQAESAHITVLGPWIAGDLTLDPSIDDHVTFEHVQTLSDTSGLADEIRRIDIDARNHGPAELARPIYVWPKNSATAALMATQILQLDGQRVVIISTSETPRNWLVNGIAGRSLTGRISVINDEFVATHDLTGVVPDQELLALGLHSYHRARSGAARRVTGGVPFLTPEPTRWEQCHERSFYFNLASTCLDAITATGLTVEPGSGPRRTLSNETVISLSQEFARRMSLPFDTGDTRPDAIRSRYRVIDLVSSFPALLGTSYRLVDKSDGCVLSDSQIVEMAQDIHAEYLRAERARSASETASISTNSQVEWDALPNRLRESNHEQARGISARLAVLGLVLAPLEESADWDSAALGPEVVEVLAELEHWRWSEVMVRRGYTFGPERNDTKRTHPDIKPYEELDEPSKEKDRRTVRLISAHLTRVGMKAVAYRAEA